MYPKIIDISWCQSQIDWAKLKELKVAVIMRCGQADYEDSRFQEHWANAARAGVLAGIYYFYQPNLGPESQIAAFLRIYNGLTVKPKVIFLDVEDICVGGGQPNIVPPSVITHSVWLWTWLSQVESETGVTPGIYTRADYWNQWTTRSYNWGRYPLWIASWLVYAPDIRLPLDWTKWTVWQYEGGTGRQEGVEGPCDLDVYNGSQVEMERFFGETEEPEPVTLESLDVRLKVVEGEIEKIKAIPIYQQHLPVVMK
jgi:lysozyme